MTLRPIKGQPGTFRDDETGLVVALGDFRHGGPLVGADRSAQALPPDGPIPMRCRHNLPASLVRNADGVVLRADCTTVECQETAATLARLANKEAEVDLVEMAHDALPWGYMVRRDP